MYRSFTLIFNRMTNNNSRFNGFKIRERLRFAQLYKFEITASMRVPAELSLAIQRGWRNLKLT